ncbi:MAG: hypothetical protein ACKVRP_13385 [Bacteroidota bacterium]
MKSLPVVALLALVIGCGPDRALMMETKFDAPLRQKMSTLANSDEPVELMVRGTCTETIDGPMRQALVSSGADVLTMNGDTFTAKVSSEDVFSVAALEFVSQLRLAETGKK